LSLSLFRSLSVNKHKPWIETSYHGVIMENTDVVLLDPPLVALDKDAPVPYAGEICAFRVHALDDAFEAVVLNSTSGEGQLRARRPIDCEHKKEYTFIIQAHDCGAGPRGTNGKRSHKAVVHVQVGDVNEFSPVFSAEEYEATVTEGRVYDSILQVQASDQDCSLQYSQICSYHITTPNTPFAVDRNGNIRNTERLSYEVQSEYKISVTALDCGQKRATRSATVHIHVKPVCKPGWRGWNKRVDYEPGSGSKPLFPKMHLETCDGAVSSVRATVQLQTSHIGKGCDRETYSEKSLQKLCGASSGSTDLLPAPSSSTNWTASLLTDSEHDSDLIFQFDGRQAAKIPDWVVPQNLTDQFTIATWMKHGPSPGLRADKETLLCNSDKTEMNRHHYSLYVHNCRLVFLLRRDFTQADTFRPAEFHWKLEQICDKEWHYYVINVEFPVVALYVDGVTYDPYLVTDDWPIHASQVDVQLTVGACWQGGEVSTARFSQYFRGSLSGLMVRPGKIESQKVISCLQACKEALDLNSVESLDKGIKFHFNPAQSVLVMEGEDLERLDSALRKVSYINSRQFPTAGIRHLRISTAVQCFDEDVCISVPDIDAVVAVLQPSEPRITITGAEHLTAPASDLRNGLSLFQDVHIVSTVTKANGPVSNVAHKPGMMEEMIHNLDYCDILVLGEELKAEQEGLYLHSSSLSGKHLDYTNSTSGMSIYGVDSIFNYAEVIRQVRYQNLQPNLSSRSFSLTCSELNGRYISNQFKLEVAVLHSSEAFEHVNHMAAPPRHMQVVRHPIMIPASHSSAVPSAATVVIVVCVAALLVVVLMGVYRLHLTHVQDERDTHTISERHTARGHTALTITVNPMEGLEDQQAAEEDLTEDEDEEDESTSCSESDSDEEGTTAPSMPEETERSGQLQWTNSTLLLSRSSSPEKETKAGQSALIQSLSEHLCCPGCETLPVWPVSLPCGHCLCQPCLAAQRKKNPKTSNTPASAPEPSSQCSRCLASYPLYPCQAWAFPPNALFAQLTLRMLDTHPELCRFQGGGWSRKGGVNQARPSTVPVPQRPQCDLCPKHRPALRHCRTCGLNYCSKCLRKLHGNRAFQVHSLVEPVGGGGRELCPVHSERGMTHCCLTDSTLGCQGCMVDGHSGHEVVLVNEARARMESELQMALEHAGKVGEQCDADLADMEALVSLADSEGSELRGRVRQGFLSLRNALLDQEAILLSQIDSVSSTTQSGAQGFLTKACPLRHSLAGLVVLGHQALLETQASVFLRGVDALTRRVCRLTSDLPRPEPTLRHGDPFRDIKLDFDGLLGDLQNLMGAHLQWTGAGQEPVVMAPDRAIEDIELLLDVTESNDETPGPNADLIPSQDSPTVQSPRREPPRSGDIVKEQWSMPAGDSKPKTKPIHLQPRPPIIYQHNASAETVEIFWMVPMGEEVETFDIHIQDALTAAAGVSEGRGVVMGGLSGFTLRTEGLHPDTQYLFRARSVNKHGPGAWSSAYRVHTEQQIEVSDQDNAQEM
ncbi:calsyntenin-2-like, partial [Chanos chanos]|uniref:Calsyntenin-2 n=1 Tax=Chanos chanos TaxID=29144 RepID=A0A6J2VL94_CHACN